VNAGAKPPSSRSDQRERVGRGYSVHESSLSCSPSETFTFLRTSQKSPIFERPVETALPRGTISVPAKRVREITSHGLSDVV
jgi:hypothetical protein